MIVDVVSDMEDGLVAVSDLPDRDGGTTRRLVERPVIHAGALRNTNDQAQRTRPAEHRLRSYSKPTGGKCAEAGPRTRTASTGGVRNSPPARLMRYKFSPTSWPGQTPPSCLAVRLNAECQSGQVEASP